MATPFSATPIMPIGTQEGAAAISGSAGRVSTMFCASMEFGIAVDLDRPGRPGETGKVPVGVFDRQAIALDEARDDAAVLASR